MLRAWGARHGVAVSILRAPGIYAADRLPIERLLKGTPALAASDDVYTNHIHADDLATACIAALRRGKANRAYNVVDDSDLKMAEYFDLVAQAFDLPKAPRLSRAEAEKVLSPVQMSFMRESRRIGNRRLKHELKLTARLPDRGRGDCERKEKRMLVVKTLHIWMVISWFAGLFYLPRIFVNLAMVPADSHAERDRLLLMAGKLFKFMTPLGILAVAPRPVAVVRLRFRRWLAACQDRAGHYPCGLSLALWPCAAGLSQRAPMPSRTSGSVSTTNCRWSCC